MMASGRVKLGLNITRLVLTLISILVCSAPPHTLDQNYYEKFDVDSSSFSPISLPPNSGKFSLKFCNIDFISILFTSRNRTLESLFLNSNPFDVKTSSICNINFLETNSDSRRWIVNLLFLAGDLELNPGPRDPCGVCNKQVKWTHKAVACDNCNIWYHKSCMVMNSKIYDALSNISWYCCACGLPSFSSSFFENSTSSSSSLDNSNRFEPLSDNFKFRPKSCSTPNSKFSHSKLKPNCKPRSELKCLVANFQSISNKKEELSNLTSANDIDIIIGTETWIEPNITNSELLLNNYDIYRIDRVKVKNKLGKSQVKST